MARTTGTFERSTVAGESVAAFIPHPLPPAAPPLDLGGELTPLLARASESVRLLELAGDLVPSVDWFVYAFVSKEAVLSAQIEGTQATPMDLLEVEASGEAPVDADVEEVCGYVDALNFAWEELGRGHGLPISMRLLSETHARLLSGAGGAQKQPGEVWRTQSWIGPARPGNAAFVPPPPHRLGERLSELERAIHDDSDLPPLVRVGLLHVQFETLHPYFQRKRSPRAPAHHAVAKALGPAHQAAALPQLVFQDASPGVPPAAWRRPRRRRLRGVARAFPRGRRDRRLRRAHDGRTELEDEQKPKLPGEALEVHSIRVAKSRTRAGLWAFRAGLAGPLARRPRTRLRPLTGAHTNLRTSSGGMRFTLSVTS